MAPAPTIPIDQLRAQIANFRYINTDKDKSWVYIVGGGSGSGLILLLIICGCLYWRCKNPQHSGARSPPHVTYTAPENQNMMHTTEDAIRSTRGSDLGLKTVRIQDPVGDMGKVVDVRVQHAFTEAVLDQLGAKWHQCQRASQEAKEKAICCSS